MNFKVVSDNIFSHLTFSSNGLESSVPVARADDSAYNQLCSVENAIKALQDHADALKAECQAIMDDDNNPSNFSLSKWQVPVFITDPVYKLGVVRRIDVIRMLRDTIRNDQNYPILSVGQGVSIVQDAIKDVERYHNVVDNNFWQQVLRKAIWICNRQPEQLHKAFAERK